MIADDVECIPRELWRWGIENRSGKLRNVPEDIVKLHLMPSDTATVTPRGIRFKNLYYGSPLMLKERWTEKARINGTWKLEVCFDPRNMNYIYIKDADGINFEKCYLLDHQVRYRDKTFDEIQNLLAAEKLKQKKAADSEAQAKAELIAEIQHIVQEAQKAAAAAKDDGESNAKKKRSIRANRQAEKLANREKEAFELNKEPSKGLAPVVILGGSQDSLGEEEGQLGLLKRKQKEALKKRDG
ncbi:Mu transposase C-terminal domain-containing protein [Thermoanaerobacter mathranii]|uniref:Mu transposase C-terminal domain-containing protein n=1 Tax=Thermoanaerobacter mathranii TaxID=583357 RepID=UPI001E4D2140|nr:Mu transposase C-terminal domain-containing protein [Thermoanaerobacter mathranii]